MTRTLTRRTEEGELEALRWRAFRNYLKDFPRMKEMTPNSIGLWDRYLIYGIGLGSPNRLCGRRLPRTPAR